MADKQAASASSILSVFLWGGVIIAATLAIGGGMIFLDRPAGDPVVEQEQTDHPDQHGPEFHLARVEPALGKCITDQLIVFFEAPIQAPPVQEIFTSKPLTFSPAVKGQFQWGADYIAFQPEKPFDKIAKRFNVTISPDLHSTAGGLLREADRELSFLSESPVFESLRQVSSSAEEKILGLRFSVPMEMKSIAELLQAEDAQGESLAITPVSTEASQEFQFRLAADVALPITLSLQAGALDASTKYQTQAATSLSYPDYKPFPTPQIAYVDENADYFELELLLVAEVDRRMLLKHLSIQDKAGNPVELFVDESAQLGSVFPLRLPKSAALPLRASFSAGMRDSAETRLLGQAVSCLYPAQDSFSVQRSRFEKGAFWKANTVSIEFNQPIQPESAKEFIYLENRDKGERIDYAFKWNSASQALVLLPAQEIKGQDRIRLVVSEGLVSATGIALEKAYSSIISGVIQPLQIRYTDWREEGVKGPVLYLSFNARLKASEVAERLHIEPAVDNLQVEAGSYRSILIKGDFKSKTKYRITLSEGLSDTSKEYLLKKDLSRTLYETPKVRGVSFGQEGKLYFPKRSAGNLEVLSRNIPEVSVKLARVFPNNIIRAIQRMEEGVTSSDFNASLSKALSSTTLRFPKTEDITHHSRLNLEELMPENAKGVFTVHLNPTHHWQNTRVLLWTDLGVLGHWQNDEVAIFVHELFSLAPVGDARVTVYSNKYQEMGQATTNAQGMVVLRDLDTSLGYPRVAVVESEEDYTFLELRAREDDSTGFTAAMPQYAAAAYDGFIYTDRDLYRPGATVHTRCLVRTHYGKALPDVPLEFQVLNPSGRKVRTEIVTLSEWGSASLDLTSQKAWPTGKYSVQLWVPGAKAAIANKTIHLEDFVPNRIKSTVDLKESYWTPQQPYALSVHAEHLFGGDASNRDCEGNVILQKASFTHPEWKAYHFENEVPFETKVIPLGEKKTNQDGIAQFSFTWRPDKDITCPLKATVCGEVSELGGRAVMGTAELPCYPAPVLLGNAATLTETGHSVDLMVAAVQPDGLPAQLNEVQLTLEKEEWSYYVRRYHDHHRPSWDKEYEVLETFTAPLEAGKGSIQIPVPEGYGRYRIRVHSKATSHFSTLRFNSYWRDIEIIKEERPSLIKVTTNQSRYLPGEEVVLRIESPFDGQGIVVLQGERIYKTVLVPVKEGLGEYHFKVRDWAYPNLWAEVTVVHEVRPDALGLYPYSSFAMCNIPVHRADRVVQVRMSGIPEESRPMQAITVQIATKDSAGDPVAAELTLAAVDEGIHNILGYDNPDPAAWFERSRQPEFRRNHYYDKVAYDFDPAAIGGGLLARRMGDDLSSIGDNWIKPLALWSGPVRTDAQGHASVTLDIPEFNGQIRWVAVATTKTATGVQSLKSRIKRPVMLRSTMPRFVSPADRFSCSATVFNTTDQAQEVRLSWESSGALVAKKEDQLLSIPAKKESLLQIDFAATNSAGQGMIQWRAELLDASGKVQEAISKQAPIPVRHPATYERRTEMAVLDPGATISLDNTVFLDDDRLESVVSLTANPLLKLRESLNYLVGYPYGCVEQTTSRCLPMFMLRQAGELLPEELASKEELDDLIASGVDRLFSMQTPSGGLSFWPGNRDPYSYGSVYACHFLTLLHREHYSLPEEAFQSLQDYVRSIATDWREDSLGSMYQRAYAVYVLALDGDAGALDMIARFDNYTVSRAARYLLSAALAMNIGDQDRVQQYLETMPMSDFKKRYSYGILSSKTKSQAIELLALIHMKAPFGSCEKAAQPLLRFLDDVAEKRHHGSTHEFAFVSTALGLYFAQLQGDSSEAAGIITTPGGEKTLAPTTKLLTARHKGAGGNFVVRNTGQCKLYAQLHRQGIPIHPNEEAVSEGIAIARQFRDEQKTEVTDLRFEHGKNYVVKLTLTCEEKVAHVIVSDLLPGGFEIENPRLDAKALAASGLKNSATPDHLEIRDDRLIVSFPKFAQGTHHFYYLVRAVTRGEFEYPTVTAECMYAPELRGGSAAARMTVE